MAPTLIASYPVYQLTQTTSAITSPSFTPSNGELLVVKMSTWDTNVSMGTPTGGGQTFTQAQVSAPGGFNQWAGVFTAQVSGSPGSMTVSSTPSGSSVHSMVVERWSSAKIAASPAVCSPINGSGTPSSTVTTTGTNSVVSWTSGDANSRDPSTRAYLSSATEDGLQDGHIGTNGVSYFAYQTAAAAGAQTVGLSAPASQAWVIAGVEIQASAGGGSVTATDTAPATDAATRTAAFSRTASDTAAATDAATRSVATSRGTSDSAAATDTAARSWAASRSLADTAPASDSASRVALAVRACSDTAAASDTATRTVHLSRTAADTAAATDVATIPHTTQTNAIFEFGAVVTRWAMQGALPMPLTQSVLSTVYVQVLVRPTVHGAPYNPSADAVALAFISGSGNPGPSDWHSGSWDPTGPIQWVAQCLVGPGAGGVSLATGTYNVWIKVTDNPEIPVVEVGQLVIV